ncbi:hypothetical protein ES703_74354 [subsurface metagenome]
MVSSDQVSVPADTGAAHNTMVVTSTRVRPTPHILVIFFFIDLYFSSLFDMYISTKPHMTTKATLLWRHVYFESVSEP